MAVCLPARAMEVLYGSYKTSATCPSAVLMRMRLIPPRFTTPNVQNRPFFRPSTSTIQPLWLLPRKGDTVCKA